MAIVYTYFKHESTFIRTLQYYHITLNNFLIKLNQDLSFHPSSAGI